MAKEKAAENKGQQKEHAIFNADGTPALAEDGTQLTMTQAEWRARDKTVGYTRAEDDVEEEAPAEGEAEAAPTDV